MIALTMAKLAESLIAKSENGKPIIPMGGRLDAYFHDKEIPHTHREGAIGVPVITAPSGAQIRRAMRKLKRTKLKKNDNVEN